MTALAALALYPVLAIVLATGLTVLRLGRRAGSGLVALCFATALWVAALILLHSPSTTAIAERALPAGVFQAAAFVHAVSDIARRDARRVLRRVYGLAALVALLGALAPSLFYGPGARGAGVLFAPLALVGACVGIWIQRWMFRLARAAEGPIRRRIGALAIVHVLATASSGGVIALHVFGFPGLPLAAPLLFVSTAVAVWAVLRAEEGPGRRLVLQGLVHALATATLSSVGLVAFFLALPFLSPDGGASIAWLMLITFFAALPLDPFRLLIVERLGRELFRDPIGVRDLTERVERTEARADHAERLAEIGAMASAVAHEIRNPLGVIAAHAKILERQGADEGSVAQLREEVERAKRFLDDLLRYSRPRPLEVTDIDVRATLSSAAKSVADGLGDTSAEIAIEASSALVAEGDRGGFFDVAAVLIHNAAIAVAELPEGRVLVRAFAEGSELVVQISDSGPGVPPEIEASLFKPFVTGRGRDARHPGTGLGLAIAAHWLVRHGGTLVHTRPPEGGALFEARWPLRQGGKAMSELGEAL